MRLFGLVLCTSAMAVVMYAQNAKPFIADYRETDNAYLIAPELGTVPKVIEGRYYRDRRGRLRQEDWRVDTNGNKTEMRVFISDPQSNLKYTLDMTQKRAMRRILRPCTTRKPLSNTPVPPSGSGPTDLGTKTLEGMQAHGRRGCGLPNRCTETWWVPDLGYVARMVETEPGGLTRVKRWHNFQIDTDPDPSLFQVPPGFSIVNDPNVPQCGGQTVKFKQPATRKGRA